MNKRFIAPIASAVALLGFFAPWMSCGMMTFSGMDLASNSGGSGMGDLGGASHPGSGGGEPLLFVIPLAALVIIGLFFFFKNSNRLPSAILPTIVIALLALVVMGIKYVDFQKMKSETGSGMKESLGALSSDSSSTGSHSSDLDAMMGDMISIRWGFWLTALGFLVTLYGATQYRDTPKTPEDVAATPPPFSSEPQATPSDDTSHIPQDRGMT